MPPASFRTGLLAKLASTFFFTVMLLAIKHATVASGIGQIVFFRSAIGLVPVLLWLGWRGQLRESLRPRSPRALLRRTLFGCGSVFGASAALQFIPVTYALSISYLAPLMIVLLAWLVLQETVGVVRWLALAMGLAGMAIMLLAPSHEKAAGLQGAWLPGCGLALLGAFCSAAATIEIRRLSDMPPGSLIVSFLLASALLAATTFAGWTMPSARQWWLLILSGLAGGLGQMFMMVSVRNAEASALAPLEYTTLLWAVGFALIGIGDVPGLWVFVGGAVVMVSGLMVITGERWRLPRLAVGSG
ncbi:DMT family transporter [Xylophilus sp. GOD-11R]|uniref:DMT family transporter n=1 Tax=Xylophilus sp. GOD-11R TaxID=3089814 RepID=UPI00298C8B28|nr:DMT family transporter [Xylophilus sp. GOD-11R]WPB58258.1 DMT family transporter [Xylophilus sp. GOD-11R]